MQLSFDAADRLVELVEARHGPVPAEEAARALYALRLLRGHWPVPRLDELHEPVGGVERELHGRER